MKEVCYGKPMPLRAAHQVTLSPPPPCPVCEVGITAAGRNQPVPVDEADRPYCRTHGHLVAPNYDTELAAYERTRSARARLLRDAEAAGIQLGSEELEAVVREWQEPG